MATLYISEFSEDGHASSGSQRIAVAECPPLARQTVSIGGVSAQSNAFGANTRIIRVHTDAICSLNIGGTNPTATTADDRMAADQTEYWGVNPGDKLAVITNT